MSDKIADQVIHEAMGLVWREDNKQIWNCNCLYVVPTYPIFRANMHVYPCEHASPDYAKDLRPVFEWMRRSWSDFECYLHLHNQPSFGSPLCAFMEASNEYQRDLIARWVESTRE